MRTCKALYRAGIRPLLGFTVHFSTVRTMEVESFISFMFSTNWSTLRFQSLRSFTLTTFRPPENHEVLAQRLPIIFRLATRLQFLELCTVDRLLEVYPELSRSIAALPDLQKLAIRDGFVPAMDLVSSFRSPIKDVELSWNPPEYASSSRTYVLHLRPLVRLEHLSSTLVTLTLRGVPLHDRQVRLPSVRTLTIETFPHTRSAVLVHTFPNLSVLTINSGSDLFSLDGSAILQLHQMNSTEVSTLEHQWKNPLHTLNGHATALHALAITPQVHYLCIYCTRGTLFLCDLLEKHRPKVVSVIIALNFRTISHDFCVSIFKDFFLSLSSCTHLRLNIAVFHTTMAAFNVSIYRAKRFIKLIFVVMNIRILFKFVGTYPTLNCRIYLSQWILITNTSGIMT